MGIIWNTKVEEQKYNSQQTQGNAQWENTLYKTKMSMYGNCAMQVLYYWKWECFFYYYSITWKTLPLFVQLYTSYISLCAISLSEDSVLWSKQPGHCYIAHNHLPLIKKETLKSKQILSLDWGNNINVVVLFHYWTFFSLILERFLRQNAILHCILNVSVWNADLSITFQVNNQCCRWKAQYYECGVYTLKSQMIIVPSRPTLLYFSTLFFPPDTTQSCLQRKSINLSRSFTEQIT